MGSFFNAVTTNNYYKLSPCNNSRKEKKIDRGENDAFQQFQSSSSNNVTATLQSYSYSTCPFFMSKFSLHELSLFASSSKRQATMQEIAKQSLSLSNNAKSYQRVLTALQNGAFSNRKLVLDGDSLTRQLFISLSCMLWSAGYVTDYTISNYDVWSGGENPTLKNFNYTASERFYKQVHVKLKDDGEIYYVDYFNHAPNDMIRFGNMMQSMIRSACNSGSGSSSSGLLRRRNRNSKRRYYKARCSLNKQDSPMILNKDDVVVVSAGHHDKIRPMYLDGYKKFFQCIQQEQQQRGDREQPSSSLSQWPHFFYQLSSVQGFNTIDGEYSTSQPLPGTDKLACRTEGGSTRLQKEDRDYLEGLVPFIADTIDLTNMGKYHVGGGDCTHWVQPGGENLLVI